MEQIIQAQAGFEVVKLQGEELRAEPVIGWHVVCEQAYHDCKAFVLVEGITLEGLEPLDVLKRPNGSYFMPNKRDFIDEKQVVEYLKWRAF